MKKQLKKEQKQLRDLIDLYTKEVQERLVIHQEILHRMTDDWGKYPEVDDNLIEVLEDFSYMINFFPPLSDEIID